MDHPRFRWYGKECLNPTYTKRLVERWQAPPGNVHDRYYEQFPALYPKWLPQDHYIKKYDPDLFPKDRDYRYFKSAPPEIKSAHQIEWEDGYGPCNVCNVCKEAKQKNDEQQAEYYKKLKAWVAEGKPM